MYTVIMVFRLYLSNWWTINWWLISVPRNVTEIIIIVQSIRAKLIVILIVIATSVFIVIIIMMIIIVIVASIITWKRKKETDSSSMHGISTFCNNFGLNQHSDKNQDSKEKRITSVISIIYAVPLKVVALIVIIIVIVITIVLRIILIGISRSTFISHICVKAGSPVGRIRHNLRPTIRKLYPILSTNCLTVTSLPTTKIVTRGSVFYRISEFVRFWL